MEFPIEFNPLSDPRTLTVYVLAGGQGTRIRAVIGSERPKLLALLDGRPYLDYLLDWLEKTGFRRIFFGLGHLSEPIVAALAEHRGGLELGYRVEPGPLGTAGALRLALDTGDIPADRPLMILNGDSMVEVDLRRFVRAHRQAGALASLLCVPVEDGSRFGRIEADETGRILCFYEKDPDNHMPGLINAGCYLFEPAMLEVLRQSSGPSLERDIFMGVLPFALHAVRCDAPFIDFGTPESYRQAQSFFKRFKPHPA
ncbi:MAG: sugar phosphate nucleotidyltransferase [Magnetococcus sp. YQC-9]